MIVRRIVQSAVVVLTLAASGSLSFSQQPTTPSQTASPIRAVKLNVIVTDRSNHSVDVISKDEVRVLEDSVLQTISSFSKEDQPVDYAIAIDNSGSFKPLLSPVLEAVKLLIQNQKDNDELFIERFVSLDKIETVQDFTPDKSTLLKSLSLLNIEGGQSAVIDGIYLAVQHVAARQTNSERRHALVVFTDGEDRASYYTENQLLQLLRTCDVQVFVVGMVAELDDEPGFIRQSPKLRAEKLLNTIAYESGGRVFFPTKKKELLKVASEVLHDLHFQYFIAYQSSNPSKENFRSIKVELAESPDHHKLTAITRPGYYLSPPAIEPRDKKKKPKKPAN